MRGRVIDAQAGGGSVREQRQAGRWPPGELKRLRGETDPEIDRVVEAYHREHPELDARDWVVSMIRELSQAKRDPQLVIRDEIDQDGAWLTAALNVALASPRWNIGRRLPGRGQHVLASHGPGRAAALFFAGPAPSQGAS
jgi:hypothetical protein